MAGIRAIIEAAGSQHVGQHAGRPQNCFGLRHANSAKSQWIIRLGVQIIDRIRMRTGSCNALNSLEWVNGHHSEPL